ncbi:MAG: riboflavin biosynthesis protein RibF, partial [Sphingomicrobium sp.]
MKRLSLATHIPERLNGAIVALGNFDGFHRGHQAVVNRAVQRAFHERRPVIVATFDPHPVRLFKPEVPPFRLTSLDQRERLFAGAGADAMLVFEFTRELAATSAEDFVGSLLIERLGAGGIVTGDDFTFGKGRVGNVEVLAKLAAKRGIVAEAVGPVSADQQRVSSGFIREALAAGDLATATALLTRPFAIEGVIEDGDKRGRGLGFPTANVQLGDYQRPRYGIYAVRVRLDDGRELPGVASLGIRPTFEPPRELLETFIFDFDEPLYGRTIEVALH